MLYKNRLLDIVSKYLSKTKTYNEISEMLTVSGEVSKKDVEANIDGVLFSINKLIDEQVTRTEGDK